MQGVKKRACLIGIMSLFMTLFPVGIAMANESDSVETIQLCELTGENNIINGFDVETLETKSEDGLLVQETSIPISQIIFIETNESDDVIEVSQLGEDTRSEIKEKMRQAIVDLDSEVSLKEYTISKEDVNSSGIPLTAVLYYEMLNENPDIFYTAPKIYTYYDSKNLAEKVSFVYLCNDNEISGEMSEDDTVKIMNDRSTYDAAVEDFLYSANIQPEMSDLEKVLAVHDTMCDWANYDRSYNAYSDYDIFVNKKGVCQAFTQAFNEMMYRLNVEHDVVGSVDMNHVWNMVKLDNEWYHIDVTWDDDPIYSGVERTYFLKSDENLSGHYGWERSDRPVASSNKYDGYFPDSFMFYEEGRWYYDDGSKFVRSRIDKSESETVINQNIVDCEVVNSKIYYVKYVRYDDDRIGKREIYFCNLDGSDQRLFKLVTVNEDGSITSLDAVKDILTCKVFYFHAEGGPRTDVLKYALPERLSISSFNADKRPGQFVETPINLKADMGDVSDRYEYKFYFRNETTSGVIQDYSSSNTAVFCPENAGAYDIYVSVKDSSGRYGVKAIDDYIILDSSYGVGVVPFYTTHVQNVGWQNWVSDGEMSGTESLGLRLEGIKIELAHTDYDIGISYSTHVQNIGWQNSVTDGEMSGTEGLSYRIEAINMNLTGTDADKFDIYYRVHAQNIGWMGWAKNGVNAGTAGYSYRLEGIEIRIVNKGASAPGSTENAFQDANQENKYTDDDYTVIPYAWDPSKITWTGFADAKYMRQGHQESIAMKININDYKDIDMIMHCCDSKAVKYNMVIYTGDVKFFEAGDFYNTGNETSVLHKLKGTWSTSEIHMDGVKIVFSTTFVTGVTDTIVYMVRPEEINNLGHTV